MLTVLRIGPYRFYFYPFTLATGQFQRSVVIRVQPVEALFWIEPERPQSLKPVSVDGVHFCLDAKTNQKNQGCPENGYLRLQLR